MSSGLHHHGGQLVTVFRNDSGQSVQIVVAKREGCFGEFRGDAERLQPRQ